MYKFHFRPWIHLWNRNSSFGTEAFELAAAAEIQQYNFRRQTLFSLVSMLTHYYHSHAHSIVFLTLLVSIYMCIQVNKMEGAGTFDNLLPCTFPESTS